MNNLHISLTNIKNESRIFKTASTLINYNFFDNIYIVGLHDEGLLLEDEFERNILINRIDLKSRKLPKNIFFQILKYFEFIFRVLIQFRNKNIKVVNIHSVGLLPLGLMYKLIFKTKLIYDTHELETEVEGLIGVKQKIVKILEKVLIKYCDRVIVVGNAIAEEYKKNYPFIKKPDVILNVPYLRHVEKQNIFRERFKIPKEKIIFLYQGALMEGRGIEELLDVFPKVSNKVIIFMGYGPFEYTIKNYSKEHDNIFYHEAVDFNKLLDYTSSADIGLSLIQNSCLSYYYCMPNKLFEYAMAGVPVIVSNLYEMKKIVSFYKIGIVIDIHKDSLIEKINLVTLESINEYKISLLNFTNDYNWENETIKLKKIYKELLLHE